MSILEGLLLLSGLAVGITVHEFAHAWSASLLGDDFARRQGRVSLNPLRHLSLLGTLAVFFLHFGWGKPVQVNLYNFRRPKRDYLLTSLAGPLANLLVVGVCYLAMLWTRNTYSYGRIASALLPVAHHLLAFIALINMILAIINLIPIPPLDGSKIWPCLIPGLKPAFGKKTTWLFMILLLGLLYTGSLGRVIRFGVNGLMRVLPKSQVDAYVEDLDKADEEFNKGKAAYEKEDYAAAEKHFSKALAKDPYVVAAAYHHWRAYARSAQGNWQGALEDMNRAIERWSWMPEFFEYRARIHARLRHFEKAAADRLTAFKLLREAGKTLSKEQAYQEQFDKGNAAYHDDDYATAEGYYSAALAIDPDSDMCYYSRALARDLQDNLQGALEDMNRAIELDGRSPVNYEVRADIHDELEHFEQAVEDRKTAFKLLREAGKSLSKDQAYEEQFDKGDVAYFDDDDATAEKHYSAALAIDPDSDECYYSRALARELQGNWQGALEDMSRAIELSDKDPDYFDYRAEIHEELRHFELAARDRRTAAELRTAAEKTASQTQPAGQPGADSF